MIRIVSNKNTTISLVLIALVTLMSQSSMAKSIDDQQKSQKQRIYKGVKSGELTANETWRLGQQQNLINKKESRFKSDGKFTKRERAVIRHELLKSSVSIHKQKDDRQKQITRGLRAKRLGINKRQRKQANRIYKGIRSGVITKGEAIRLGVQQARIQSKKRHFKSNGHFTRVERLKVHRSQDRASMNIYRKKHN